MIFIYEGSKKTVAVTLNGKEQMVKTHADTVQELMDELDISVHPKDSLFPEANTQVKENLEISWKQAKQVTLNVNQHKWTIWTTANTVEGLLKEQKINLNKRDQISMKLHEPIKNKMELAIKLAVQLTLIDGGKKQQVWSASATVADFLTTQGIVLNKLDRIEPGITETINMNGEIKIIRVEKVTDVVEEPIQFAVVTKKDSTLQKGTQKTIAKGQHGLVSRKYEVILENGKEVNRELISEQKIREKQDQVVAVGTKELNYQVSRGAVETGVEFYVKTTAYSANCRGCSGHTASGINLHANPNMKVVAVDPKIIPLGTKVYVEGYGYAVAADTGSAIKGYKIDVFFPSNADCYRWGVRTVKVKILK